MICDKFGKNDKVKVTVDDGCYFVKNKNLIQINGDEKVEKVKEGTVKCNCGLHLKKIKKRKKHNDETEQYITSMYRLGNSCENALWNMVEENIKKTKYSNYTDQYAMRPLYEVNYDKRRSEIECLKNNKWNNKETGEEMNEFNFYIPKTIKHFTSIIGNHGSEDRCFIVGHGGSVAVEGILLDHFERIKDEDFQRLSTCYIKSGACHGAYHDGMTTIFDEIQKKLKKCEGNAPKCFVSLVKKDYALVYKNYFDKKTGKVCGVKNMPYSNDPEKKVDYEELCKDKNKYFDYYYVTPDTVYKVDHELVHNRVDLIEKSGMYDKDGKWKKISFDEALKKYKKKKCFKRYDFTEFYDYKEKKEQEKNGNLNNLNTGQTGMKK